MTFHKNYIYVPFLIIVGTVGLLFLQSYRIQHDARQKIFVSSISNDLMRNASYPSGLYKGSTSFPQSIWKGKKFNAGDRTGINQLQFGSKQSEGFPFKMEMGLGNVDKNYVLKIDYNVPENFILTRLIVDEVVLTKEGHYLGKLELRIWPGKVLPLAYFELTDNNPVFFDGGYNLHFNFGTNDPGELLLPTNGTNPK